MNQARPVTTFQIRLLVLGLLTSLWVLAIVGRLVHLTVFLRDDLKERAELQHQHTMKLDSQRGSLLDRNGRALATTVDVESVYGVPRRFGDDELDGVSLELARCLEMDADKISERLKGDRRFVWLERKASPTTTDCVRGLDLDGVGFVEEARRFYPKRHLAAQVLGYVGIDNEGMSGVEYALEEQIRGEPGRRIIWSDARNRRAASRVDVAAKPGRTAFLTIDENLQHIAETELAAAVSESRSQSGIAIVMRPDTGELLAMSSVPSFNPNRYGDYPSETWRNRPVSDVYEPGSTFKIVAAAAALAENVTSEDERIDCGNGTIVVDDHVIHDAGSFDVLTFREVVEKSSNVGMVRIGQRLGRERFEHYIRAFGFGEPSGIELRGESRGILRPSDQWAELTQASIAFGQEIGVTPLQMVAAANVLASSGYLMRPRLLLGLGNGAGSLSEPFTPEPVRRVVDGEVASRLTELLVGVVENGTGRRARIPGYRVAGKTGTAQKAVPGGYSRTDYIASFVGFAPAGDPALTALVILDSPAGDHSGSRAAAVFARIVERSLRYLGVPAEDREIRRVARRWPAPADALSRAVAGGDFRRTPVVDEPPPVAEEGAPNVVGLPARVALVAFVSSGIVPELVGSGRVVEQYPSPGGHVDAGSRARLYLGAAPPEASEESAEPSSVPAVVAGLVSGASDEAPRKRGSGTE